MRLIPTTFEKQSRQVILDLYNEVGYPDSQLPHTPEMADITRRFNTTMAIKFRDFSHISEADAFSLLVATRKRRENWGVEVERKTRPQIDLPWQHRSVIMRWWMESDYAGDNAYARDFLLMVDEVSPSSAWKIGKTKCPLNRLKAVQCGNHNDVSIAIVFDGDREAEFHQMWAPYRIRCHGAGNEHFRPSDEIFDFVESQSKLGFQNLEMTR